MVLRARAANVCLVHPLVSAAIRGIAEKANSGLLSHTEQLLQQDWQGMPSLQPSSHSFLIILCTKKVPLKSTGSNTPALVLPQLY